MTAPTQKSSKTDHLLLKVALGLAVVILLLLGLMLVQQYQHIQRLDYIAAHRQSFLRSLHGSGPLSIDQASSTQAWMTFDYIDHVFSLPPQYLQTALNVTDTRYPRLTIAEYAGDLGASRADALTVVQNAIRAYSPAKQ